MASLPTYGERPAASLPSEARRAAVLGSPIAHSLSPVLHGVAYEALGLHDWLYGKAEVRQDEIGEVLAQLDPEWAGLSLTMPLKHAAMAHLDVIDPLAEAVGAVNTVIVSTGGARGRPLLVGANTDVYGIVQALREAAGEHGQQWRPRSAVILGAGATAASALAALAEMGITDPTVLARSPARAQSTVLAAHRMGVHLTLVRWPQMRAAAELVAGADVVISTLPSHGADELAAELAAELAGEIAERADVADAPHAAAHEASPSPTLLSPASVLLDVSYDPWPSALVAAWQRAGGAVAPGWAMLLHQAAEQVRLMTGQVAPVDRMRAALVAALDTP